MITHGFTVTLAGPRDASESERIAAVLYRRCEDCSVHGFGTTVLVSFDREAPSFTAAVASALADLRAEGLEAARFEVDGDDLRPFLASPAPDPPLAAAA